MNNNRQSPNPKKTQKKSADEEEFFHFRIVLLLLCVSLLIIGFIPIILPMMNKCWSLGLGTETGVIGDSIGGMTAPFFGLLNAIIVYLAFQQQIRANEIQKQALEEERIRSEKALLIQQEALEEERKRSEKAIEMQFKALQDEQKRFIRGSQFESMLLFTVVLTVFSR